MRKFGAFLHSLRVRFILSVAVVELAMVAVLVWNSLSTLQTSHAERLEGTAQNLAQIFADTSGRFLLAVDYASLELNAQKLLKQRELAYVVVVDSDGRRVAHAGVPVGGVPAPDVSVEAVADGIYDIAAPVMMSGKLRGEVFLGFSLEPMQAALALERSRSVLIAASGVFLSILIALIVGYGLTRRLSNLVGGIDAVMRGDYSQQLSVGGPSEVQHLTQGYNSMLQTIRSRIAELQYSEERFRSLVENSPDCVLMLDLDFRVEHMSSAGLRMFVLTRTEEALGRPFADLFPPASRDWIGRGLLGARDGSVMTSTVLGYSYNGSEKWLEVVLSPVRNSEKAIVSIIGTLRDVTAAKAQAAALEHMTLHDLLTDLPNRALFIDQLESAIDEAQQKNANLAVLVMDLDRFKEVNDTLGHHIGDQLLQQVAARIRQTLRVQDAVARLGGDEFAVLMRGATEQEVSAYSQRLIRALEQPIPLAELDIQVGTSVGIAMFPNHGRSAAVLLQRADVAMYYAKRQRSGSALYHSEIDPNSLRRLTMVGELRHAIDNDELVLHFQPKVDLRSRRCCGAEALVRWIHPQHGTLPPIEFVPLAEETGLIRPLTRWVLDSALHHWTLWNAQGIQLTVAVNLSVRNLMDPKLEEMVAMQLRRWNVPPEYLELEITESDIMADPERALRVLNALDEMGITLSVDDFGTGYSSLAYLKRLPVDEIKVDKSFVMGMENDDNDAMIVDATVDLAHKLGLKVVAEGVENAHTLQLLDSLHCDAAQGYFLSKPVANPEFIDWLKRNDAASHSKAV